MRPEQLIEYLTGITGLREDQGSGGDLVQGHVAALRQGILTQVDASGL